MILILTSPPWIIIGILHAILTMVVLMGKHDYSFHVAFPVALFNLILWPLFLLKMIWRGYGEYLAENCPE